MTTEHKTYDAVEILHKMYIKNDRRKIQLLQKQRENSAIARQIYKLRI